VNRIGDGAFWAGFGIWELIIVSLVSLKTWEPSRTIKAITGQNFLSTVLFRDGIVLLSIPTYLPIMLISIGGYRLNILFVCIFADDL
jgi:hypothetical protein